MKAKDLMMPLQGHLRPENTLREAVNVLRTARRGEDLAGQKGLPVFDGTGKLKGMLSMVDILKAVYPSYLSLMDLGDFTWDGMVESMASKAGEKKVGDVMTKDVITVREEDPLMECIDRMLKYNIKRLPVIDKTGKVMGMIYERDVFNAVTKTMLDANSGG